MLNLLGLELPTAAGESNYPLSSRISQIDVSLLTSESKAVFSKNCNLRIRRGFLIDKKMENYFSRFIIQNILKSKGYNYKGIIPLQYVEVEGASDFDLDLTFLLRKQNYKRVDKDSIQLDEKKFLWKSYFMKPNGVVIFNLYFRIDGKAKHLFSLTHPARIKVQSSGDQYREEKVLYSEETIMNSLLSLPACIVI